MDRDRERRPALVGYLLNSCLSSALANWICRTQKYQVNAAAHAHNSHLIIHFTVDDSLLVRFRLGYGPASQAVSYSRKEQHTFCILEEDYTLGLVLCLI